jgi:hypothetical protein
MLCQPVACTHGLVPQCGGRRALPRLPEKDDKFLQYEGRSDSLEASAVAAPILPDTAVALGPGPCGRAREYKRCLPRKPVQR